MMLVRLIHLVIIALLGVIGTSAPADVTTRILGPSPSPDGSRVAFIVSPWQSQLYFLDLESKEVQKVQTPGRIAAFYGMSWDPEGEFIVATIVEGTRQNPGPWSIWKVTVPEGKSEKIGEIQDQICQRGLVSPDGKTVLFRVTPRRDLVSVDLQSRKHRFLTESGDIYRLGYDWSPDGSKIYFSRGFMTDKDSSIWVMNADGSGKKLISDRFQGHLLGISSTGRYISFLNDRNTLFVSDLQKFNPVKVSRDSGFFDWALNNDMLAFRCGNTVKVWTPSGKQGSEGIVREIGEGHFPVWVKNGQAILFIRGEAELWKHDISSGKTEHIFSLKE